MRKVAQCVVVGLVWMLVASVGALGAQTGPDGESAGEAQAAPAVPLQETAVAVRVVNNLGFKVDVWFSLEDDSGTPLVATATIAARQATVLSFVARLSEHSQVEYLQYRMQVFPHPRGNLRPIQAMSSMLDCEKTVVIEDKSPASPRQPAGKP